ncbi:MAG: penicillin acylase family protein [Alphaproteobacteria bacterium]|nr:penicillin acylase family protein [Alphaproteobacteria bacterium]
MVRLVRRILVGLAVLPIVLGGGFYLYLRSALPQTEGRIVLSGPKAEIRIARDKDGVPLIVAQDDEDAVFGLGFVHAQERLFQMELQRRYGAGRLAEIFGPQAVGIDRQMRVLGLYRAAEAALPFLSPQMKRMLDAYSAGVNAYLSSHRGALPPEFVLLGFAPGPWRPADSLVWGKLMALQLGGNYRGELLRARMARSISAADLAFLYPQYPPDAPTTLAELRPVYRRLALDQLYQALPPLVGPNYASNNWVVDGRHSASGKPLLANDPHLPFGNPGFWYLARLKTPQHDIAGGTVAGVPLVVIGHNERIAWGFTTTTSDVEDLFIEKIDPADPGRYLTPRGSEPFKSRRETIIVHDAQPVEMTIRETRHGPVLSDALPRAAAAPGFVLALSATFTIPDDRSAEALWEVNRAADWQSFKTALRKFVGPMQNVVYADVDGTIGFVAPGLVPVRRNGHGWLPVPGWTGEYDWDGFIPFSALPSAINPPSGHFISANNKIVPASYPYFLSRDWDLPNRAERIEALLSATPIQSPQSSAAIQADTLSLMAQRLVPLMTRLVDRTTGAAHETIERLQRWDFRMDMDKVEPLLFTAWLREFSRSILVGRFGEAVSDYWDLKPRVMEAVLTQRPDWCDDPKRPGGESCGTRLGEALQRALARLRRDFGPDTSRWQWRRAHVARFTNPVLSRIPVLGDWLGVSIPTPGAYDTLNRGPSTIRDERHPFEQRYGAGLRIITDLARPADSQMIVTPGQSGSPLSAHSADLLRRWRDFEWLVPGHSASLSNLFLVPGHE